MSRTESIPKNSQTKFSRDRNTCIPNADIFLTVSFLFHIFIESFKQIKFHKILCNNIEQSVNHMMFWARLGLLRKGLKSYGTNQYPMNTKLPPKFLVLRKNPTVFTLISLYIRAEEKAIIIDLTLTSPKLSSFYSLNFVIPLDSL